MSIDKKERAAELNAAMDEYEPEVENDIVEEEPISEIWQAEEKKKDLKLETLAKTKYSMDETKNESKLVLSYSQNRKEESKSEEKSESKDWSSNLFSGKSPEKKSYSPSYSSSYSSSTSSKSVESIVDDGFKKIRSQAYKEVEDEYKDGGARCDNPQLEVLLKGSGKFKSRMRKHFGPHTKGRKVAIIGGLIFLKALALVLIEYKIRGGDRQ